MQTVRPGHQESQRYRHFVKVKIRTSESHPPQPRPLPQVTQPQTAAELRAAWLQAEAGKKRARCLGDCPGDLAAFATGVCALVYHPFDYIERRLRAAEATKIQHFDRRGSQAVAFEYAERVWLVFRGSEEFPETEMFVDWGHDMMCLPWGWPPRHLGFVRAWAKVRKPMLEWLAAMAKDKPVVLSGHSLGGALAQVAAYDIALERRAEIDAVITFGAPRVGTWPWGARYHRLTARDARDGQAERSLRNVTFRIHNAGDIVTYVPPLIFSHCGHAISATQLQAQPMAWASGALAFATAEDIPEPGFVGRIKYGYRAAKRTLPYSPLNLLLDLCFALFESAPQHFIRHYAPAFPDRPFADLGAPEAPQREGLLNWILWGVKWLVLAICIAATAAFGWLLYRASPQLTPALLFAMIVYALFPSAFSQPKVLPPSALVRPMKITGNDTPPG